MRSSNRRWNGFAILSRVLNSGRTTCLASSQQPSRNSPDAMQRSLRVQPTEWTQRLLSWSTQSTREVVGRLTIPKQDMRPPRGQKLNEYVEALSFGPWHALVEHRPLGDMMRARNVAYRVSTQARKAAGEPDGSERFD